MTLTELEPLRLARIEALSSADEGLSLSLLQLGLVPGALVQVLRQAPLGDPLEVDVGGARLAIRRAVARGVRVAPVDP